MSSASNTVLSPTFCKRKLLAQSLKQKFFLTTGVMLVSRLATGNATKISNGSTQKMRPKSKNAFARGSRIRLFPEVRLFKPFPFLFVETQAQYVRNQFRAVEERVVR